MTEAKTPSTPPTDKRDELSDADLEKVAAGIPPRIGLSNSPKNGHSSAFGK